MTWPSALDAFWPITKKLEGDSLTYMYQDERGLVTTGTGNLIDPVSAAIAAGTWYHPDGSEATDAEVTANWQLVKDNDDTNLYSTRATGIDGNDLRLSADGVAALGNNKLASNLVYLHKFFPQFDKWPADAQLGTMLMSWGLGPAFSANYPSFTRAVNALLPDWKEASAQSTWSNITKARDTAQRTMFLNAAASQQTGMDPSVIIWPGDSPLAGNFTGKGGNILDTAARKFGFGKTLLLFAGLYGAKKAFDHRHQIGAFVKDKAEHLAAGGKKVFTAAPSQPENPEPEKA